jgi:hypothetical protein
MNTKPLTLDQPARYRLHLLGRLSADWADWLPDAVTTFDGDQTIIIGTVRDRAALFGLLSYLRNIGATLLLVEYLPEIKKEKVMKTNQLKTVCNGIAIAMGVAAIVTNIVNPLSLVALTNLLGIAVAALGLAALQK